MVHKTRSPDSLKALRKGNVAWDDTTIEQLAAQKQGDAYVTTAESSAQKYQTKASACHVRPTCAMPGGTTQTGVAEDN